MNIEIINPSINLEKDILTFIPITHRFKTSTGYALDTYHVTHDPFTDRVDIFIHTQHIKMDLHFIDRVDCQHVVVHKGGI